MAAERIFNAYISYSHEDSEVVIELAQRLKDEVKLEIWLDKWELVPGQNWQKPMAEGLSHAQSIVVCIGSKTPKGWFKEEIQRALNRQIKDPSFRVIPVLLPNSNEGNVDEFLELRTWIDFRNGISDTPFYVLVCGIKGVAPGSSPEEVVQKKDLELIKLKNILEDLRELKSAGLIEEKINEDTQRKLVDNYVTYKTARAA